MAQNITYGIADMMKEANAEIETLSVDAAKGLVGREDVLIVDLRDPRELERDGTLPGIFHCPRGMLEFWIDPKSPYAKAQFQQDKKYVFFCGGGMRSALAAQVAQKMGLKPVAHIEGGFAAWRKGEGPIVPWAPKKH